MLVNEGGRPVLIYTSALIYKMFFFPFSSLSDSFGGGGGGICFPHCFLAASNKSELEVIDN